MKRLEVVMEAIALAGHKPGEQIGITLDPALERVLRQEQEEVRLQESRTRANALPIRMVEFWSNWVNKHPIVSIERTHG